MNKKVVHAVTASKSLKLMKGQLQFLNDNGFDTYFISSPGGEIEEFTFSEKSNPLSIEIEREISIVSDIKSLAKLITIIYKVKPNIVNYGTPKAGLLVSIASFVCRVPVRIYTLRGLRLETTFGFKRKVLLTAEKIAVACSTKVIAISSSLSERAIELKIVKPDKIVVLGKGSSNGFPLEIYKDSADLKVEIRKIQNELCIQDSDFVVGFVGRMTKDKGLKELIQTFTRFNTTYPDSKLLIVGDFEEGDPVDSETKNIIEDHLDIIHVSFKKNLLPYYKLMDVFLFLTKREGFGNVSLEASLSGVPVIVSDVTGARDTVINNKTGFLVNESNIEEAERKLQWLVNNPLRKKEMGIEAREWAETHFDNNIIWNQLLQLYNNELNTRDNKKFD